MSAKKPLERHTTIAGEVLEYPRPEPELAAFLERVRAAAEDPSVSEPALVELIYGRENPLLDQSIFPTRGAVTRAVFEDPVYHVMLDLLDAKRVQSGTLDPGRAAARYTMTVSEAAAELGITSSAVRQAIERKQLAAWKKNPRLLLLDPHSVATYRDHVQPRGPQSSPALSVRFGNRPGASLRVKAPGLERLGSTPLEGGGRVVDAVVSRFEVVGVAFSATRSNGSKYNHFYVLEPAPARERLDLDPEFTVEGKFRVVERVTDPEEASRRFRAFRAE